METAVAAEDFTPLDDDDSRASKNREARQGWVSTIESICGILYAEEIDLPALAAADAFHDCGYTRADDSDWDDYEAWEWFADANGLHPHDRPRSNIPATFGDHQTGARVAYRNQLHIRTNRALLGSLGYLSNAQLKMLAAYCENRLQMLKITQPKWVVDPAIQSTPEMAIV